MKNKPSTLDNAIETFTKKVDLVYELSSLRAKLDKAKNDFQRIKNKKVGSKLPINSDWDIGFFEGYKTALNEDQEIAEQALKDL